MAFYNASDSPVGDLGDFWCDGYTLRAFGSGGWITICNIVKDAGMLPLSGGTVTGPIDGNHGLMQIDSPIITGAALSDGNELVTYSLMREAINQSIAAALATKMVTGNGTDGTGSGGATSTSSVPTTVGFGFGRKSPNGSADGPIPIGPGSDGGWPYYTESDGSRTQATIDESKWCCGPCGFSFPVGLNMASGGGGNIVYKFSVNSGGTITVKSYTERDIGSHEKAEVPVNYLVCSQRTL